MFGGPHVPDQPEAFLRANPQIDLAVHNEGERTFLKLLEAWPDRDAWAALPGVSMVGADGAFVRNPNIDRVRDLDEIPSPFLEGAFDAIMAANPQRELDRPVGDQPRLPVPLHLLRLGLGDRRPRSPSSARSGCTARSTGSPSKKIEYIFCCDANFGIQKRDVDIANYVADDEAGRPAIRSRSRCRTPRTPPSAPISTQKILSDAGLNKGVALSMQSVDMPTLEAIKRDNISLGTYMELQRRFTARQGRDLFGPDPRPARRDLRIVRAAASTS